MLCSSLNATGYINKTETLIQPLFHYKFPVVSESTSELLQGQISYEACLLDEDKITMETAVIQSDANLYKARVSLKTYCCSQLFFWTKYHTVKQEKEISSVSASFPIVHSTQKICNLFNKQLMPNSSQNGQCQHRKSALRFCFESAKEKLFKHYCLFPVGQMEWECNRNK